MPTVEALAARAKSEFAFLTTAGAQLIRSEIVAPTSFKGGFVLTYALADERTRIRVRYLDMEFEVWLNVRQLFGSEDHPGFAGNMFSREHLAESLPRLAEVIRGLISNRP